MITKQDAAVPGSKELFNFSHIICENIVNLLDGHGMPENKGVFLYNDYTDTAENRSGGYPIAEHIDFAVKYSDRKLSSSTTPVSSFISFSDAPAMREISSSLIPFRSICMIMDKRAALCPSFNPAARPSFTPSLYASSRSCRICFSWSYSNILISFASALCFSRKSFSTPSAIHSRIARSTASASSISSTYFRTLSV